MSQHLASQHALIICTRNRSAALRTCLEHIYQNSVLPEIILIVDGSDQPLEPFFELIPLQFPITVKHIISDQASIPYQRNLGISELPADTKWVHFLDDDFFAEPTYFEELISAAGQFSDAVVLGGQITNEQQKVADISLYHRFFLLDSINPGRFLTSGATSEPQARDDISDRSPFLVDWVSGCSMSVSYHLFKRENLTFDETLKGYAQDEDLDFCLRAKDVGKIRVIPKAKGVHRRISHDDQKKQLLKRFISITHRYYIIKKHGTELHKLLFWWSQKGSLLILIGRYNTHKSFLPPTFSAWKQIWGSILGSRNLLEITEELK